MTRIKRMFTDLFSISFYQQYPRYLRSHSLLKHFLILFCLSFSFASAYSQKYIVADSNADCISPIELTDTIYGPTNPPKGFGKTQEMKDFLGNYYYFEKEHNTVWFKFTAPDNCTLTFDIIPVSVNDDYDFLLFKYTGNENNFCQNIKDKKIKPVRTAISRNDKTIQSTTGLKEGKIAQFIHSGPGESYSAPLKVQAGDVYYLALDNVYENGSGFTLKLHYKCAVLLKPQLNISLVDKETGKAITGNIEILDSLQPANAPAEFHAKNVSTHSLSLESSKKYRITATSDGYFSSNITFITPDKPAISNVVISLQKITVGKHLVLEKIYFYGNKAILLPESKPALETLLQTMNENPRLHIEIQGHVNWPHTYLLNATPDTAWIEKLSRMRAKAIYDYLVEKGISADRLSCRGFGNRAMVYPYANNEAEMSKNRRVEILVLAN